MSFSLSIAPFTTYNPLEQTPLHTLQHPLLKLLNTASNPFLTYCTPPPLPPYNSLDIFPCHPRKLALPHGAPQGPVLLSRCTRSLHGPLRPVKFPSQITDHPVKQPTQTHRAAIHPPAGIATIAARTFHVVGYSQSVVFFV